MFISVQLPHFQDQLLSIPFAEDGWKSVIAPFSYTAFNISLAQAVLVPVAKEVKDDRTIKWGGILGGLALTFILLSSHITLIMLPDFRSYEIPMAVTMKNLASGFYWMYVLIIYGEIFTSIIGNIFGLERQLKKYVSTSPIITVSGIFVIVFLISLVDYGTLLSYLYPVFGYISLIFMILLWIKPFKKK